MACSQGILFLTERDEEDILLLTYSSKESAGEGSDRRPTVLRREDGDPVAGLILDMAAVSAEPSNGEELARNQWKRHN